ncbi:MAG: outer membrane lipoprotein carrier protein LolA [Pyrinomonadaceae bacterium]
MNKFLRFGLTAIALTFLFSAFTVTETKAQGVLNEILKRMETHRASLRTMQSDVTMVKHDALLDEDDTLKGVVKYIPGKTENDMYIRIDWTKPDEQLAVIKTDYILYRKLLKQAIKGKVNTAKNSANAGGALSFMSMSKGQLKTNYMPEYLGRETLKSGTSAVHLKLIPKTAQKYKYAELWVDDDGMPLQMKIVEKNGDSTTVLLSSVKKNPTINAADFTINFPKDTKVIKG